MRENTDENNYKCRHFSRRELLYQKKLKILKLLDIFTFVVIIIHKIHFEIYTEFVINPLNASVAFK